MSAFMAISRGKLAGPFTVEQLRRMEQTGEIGDASQVCSKSGGSSWTTWALVKAGAAPAPRVDLPSSSGFVAARPAPCVRRLPCPEFREDGPPLSRIAYIILALFLGTAGIHNFYARRSGEGMGQIGLMVLAFTCLIMGVPVLALLLLAANGAWAIGNIIAVTRDGYGRDLI